MSERKQAIREHMVSQHAQIIDLLDQLQPGQWDTPVYTEHEGAWTVRDLISHLADATKGQIRTVRMISTGEDPIPADFDLARWNKHAVEKSKERSNAELEAIVRDKFTDWLDLLDEIDEAALDSKGRHPSLAILSIEEFLRLFTSHEASHAADIRAALDGS